MIAKSINILSRVFIWDNIVARMLKGLVPILLIQCISLGVYIVAFLIIIGMIFGKSIVGVLTTLGGLGVIIGFGAQRLVLDAFSGISINIDRSFTLGDFIKITTQDYTLMGKVTKVSWRLTTLLTQEGTQISIPNSVVSGVPVTNLSKPDLISEFQQIFYFSPHSHDKFVDEILMNAALSVAKMGYIEKDPLPKIRLSEIKHYGGLGFDIVYFADPLKNTISDVKHFLHTAVLRHVKASGLHFNNSNGDHVHNEYNLRAKLIGMVPLFDCLNPEESKFLLSNITNHSFKPKTPIVLQGEKGTSMYIIKQGFVTIHIQDENTKDSIVDILNPGDFFGEMSLLTGEKRSATVTSESEVITYEITKETILHLLNDNPNLYEEFAKITAHKMTSTQEHLKKLSHSHEEKKHLIDDCLLKIKAFFT